MRNFIHKARTRDLELGDHDPTATIGDIAARYGGDAELVFVNDDDAPADPTHTLEHAGVGGDGHIHIARCRRVAATVHFKEDSKSHEFPPNVAINAVFEWAAGPNGFDLNATDKAEHMLVMTGTETAADEDTHLEAYATDECTAEFDLVPKHRFEG